MLIRFSTSWGLGFTSTLRTLLGHELNSSISSGCRFEGCESSYRGLQRSIWGDGSDALRPRTLGPEPPDVAVAPFTLSVSFGQNLRNFSVPLTCLKP